MGTLLSNQLTCHKCGAQRALLKAIEKGFYKSGKKVKDTRYIQLVARCPSHGKKGLTMPFHTWDDENATITHHILICEKCGQPTQPHRFKMGSKLSTIETQCSHHGIRKRQISTTLASPIWQYASKSTSLPTQPSPPQPPTQHTTHYCPQCGNPTNPKNNFCETCGESLL